MGGGGGNFQQIIGNLIFLLAFVSFYLLLSSVLKGVRADRSFALALDSLRMVSKNGGSPNY